MRLFLIALLLLAALQTGAAASQSLVVILLPGTSLQDWQAADAPNLHRLMQTGALALMNTRSAHQPGQSGRETPQSVLLTLGAGARAASADEPLRFSPASSLLPSLSLTAGALFERRTGRRPPPHSGVCTDWPALVQANRNPGYDLRLGSLADTLTAHGIRIESGGDSDAEWVAAGADGTVRYAPRFSALPGHCLVWDAGSSPSGADALIGTAASQTAKMGGHLLILSPYPSVADYARDRRLTPLLAWGMGIQTGLLVSPSTRHAGLVTDTDFAPSVSAEFGIPRADFTTLPFGFAWSVVPVPNPVQNAEQLSRQSVRQAGGMRLLPYLAAVSSVWILAGTLLPNTRRTSGFWALVPLTALIAAVFSVSVLSFWFFLAGLSALTFMSICFAGQERTSTLLTGFAALALTADMLIGNPLMHHGLLGYSAIEGARYYGVGNEAMGLLLGAALITASRLWSGHKQRHAVLAAWMAVITLLLGSAGAKAGGVLVFLAVFGTFLYTASGRRWSARAAALLAVIAAVGLAAAALGDAFLMTNGHSHLGEAVLRIMSGGPAEAEDIIGRKLAVEGRLATHSAWALLLWIGFACTGLSWRRTPAALPAAAGLRLAAVVGVVTCLLFNDAGVVAAALFVLCLCCDAATQKQSLPATE